MLLRPRFKPHLRLATVPEEGVFVLSASRHVLLRGRLYESIAEKIDGRSADEICDSVSSQVSPAEVFFTLARLEKMGLLVEEEETLPAGDAAWWSLQQVDPKTAAGRLADKRISVQGLGTNPEPLLNLLKAAGVQIAAEGDLTVVLAQHYLQSELSKINQEALASGRPWLLVKPGGRQLWLGPLFQPESTGCWSCLAERLRSHHAVETYLYGRESLAQPLIEECSQTAAAWQTAWGLISNAIASWIVCDGLPDCVGKIRTFDHVSWQTVNHTLIRLSYCAACGRAAHYQATNGVAKSKTEPPRRNGHVSTNGHASPGRKPETTAIDHHESAHDPETFRPLAADVRSFAPPDLQPRKKSFVNDGGHRVIDPHQTLERFGHHVSPITGAVSVLEKISPRGDNAIHVYLAGHNLARRHRTLRHLRGDLRNMSAGKGATDIQAKASGLCEGLERYSGVFRGDEPRVRARMIDLGDAAIDVRTCLLFSERQYDERETSNAVQSMYGHVPKPFHPEAEIDWSPVWSLTRRTFRYLPTSFCYYDFPHPEEHDYCIACSNGNAAGNTLEEAILQGFLELVERDSVALWWYNRVHRPGVDLASFREPYLAELERSLSEQGRELQVIDLTSDLDIPVFAAWSRLRSAAEEQIVLGFGAHLDARIALLRAVTEMNQMLGHLLQAPVDSAASDVDDHETLRWLKTATAENQSYLNPESGTAFKTAGDYRRNWSDDILEDVLSCQKMVERQGLEMLVLDQTRPEVQLPVVKVIVPGLRHFWARFAPGRLYEAPVRLGWLNRELSEQELNPIPMFL